MPLPTITGLKLPLGHRSTCKDVLSSIKGVPGNLVSDLKKCTTIITGGTMGIGRETAKNLAYLGGDVVVGSRSQDALDDTVNSIKTSDAELQQFSGESILKASDLKVQGLVIDLASLKSVQQFAHEIKTKISNGSLPKLRLLICNAGVLTTKHPWITDDGFERTVGINYLGHYLLIKLLSDAPDIWSTEGGRIVVVSSIAAVSSGLVTRKIDNVDELKTKVFGYTPNEPIISDERKKRTKPFKADYLSTYASSKLALTLMTQDLFMKDIKLGSGEDKRILTTISVHPGLISTQIFSDIPKTAALIKCCFARYMKSIAQGASTTFVACLVPDEYAHGQFLADCKEIDEPKLTKGEFGDRAREALSIVSEEYLKDYL